MERKIESVNNLPLAECYISEQNTRPLPSENAVDIKSLALSIKHKGQITPGLVRSTKKGYEICAGARRFVACKVAGEKFFKAVVRLMNDDDFEEQLLTENMQRVDADPMGEARLIERLVNRGMTTPEQLGAHCGKSRHWAQRRLGLLKVIPAIRKKYEERDKHPADRWHVPPFKHYSIEMLEFIGSLPIETQNTIMVEGQITQSTSKRELINNIDRFLHRLDKVPFDLNDPATFVKGCGPGCACDSSKQSALFDFDKKSCGRCLNPTCLHARTVKYQAATVAKLTKENGPIKVLSTRYGTHIGNGAALETVYSARLQPTKDYEKVILLDDDEKVKIAYVPKERGNRDSHGRTVKSKSDRLKERKLILQGKRWHKVRQELEKAIEAAPLKQCVENVVELVLAFGLHYTTEVWTFKEAFKHWFDRKRKGFPVRGNKFTYGFNVTQYDKRRDDALWESFKPVLNKLILLPGNVGAACEGEGRLTFVASLIEFPIKERKRAADLEIRPPKSWGSVDVHTLEPVEIEQLKKSVGLANRQQVKNAKKGAKK